MADRARSAVLSPDSGGDIRHPPVKSPNAPVAGSTARAWWNLDALSAAKVVVSNVQAWQLYDIARLQRLHRLARCYSNRLQYGNDLDAARMDIYRQRYAQAFSANVTKSCVDTVAAMTGQSRPRPFYVSSDGNWKGQQQCRDLNRFMTGVFYECGFDSKADEITLDALRVGEGWLHYYPTKERRVGIERVPLDEIWLDYFEAIQTHNPRQLCRIRQVDREELIAQYPEEEGNIRGAGNPFQSHPAPILSVADLVTVIEAWRLPDGPNHPGKYLICTDQGPLKPMAPFKRRRFPFSRLKYSNSPDGYWATGLVEELEPNQRELNSLYWTIKGSMDIAGTFKWFVPNAANLNPNHLTNALGAILTGDSAPMSLLAQIVQPEIYAWVESIINRMYAISGVSQLKSSGVVPVGLKSGEAQRVNDAISSQRFADFDRKRSRLSIDAADHVIDIVQELAGAANDDGKLAGYKLDAADMQSIESIDWQSLEYKPNMFTVQCLDVSSLPKEISGRIDTITDLSQAGMIDPDMARDLLALPDIDTVESLFRQHRLRIMKSLDTIILEGKLTLPDKRDNLPLAHVMALRYYKLAQNQRAPEDRLLKLDEYIEEVIKLKDQAEKEQIKKQQQLLLSQQPPPQANPLPPPTSELLPRNATPQQAA